MWSSTRWAGTSGKGPGRSSRRGHARHRRSPARGAHAAGGTLRLLRRARPTLAELARRIDAGELRPVIGEVYPLERGREAFEAKRRPGVPGKVVLRVAR